MRFHIPLKIIAWTSLTENRSIATIDTGFGVKITIPLDTKVGALADIQAAIKIEVDTPNAQP